mgnify:FL=1
MWRPDELSTFWRFVAERHEIFRCRVLLKEPPPWSGDVILNTVKFTNIYRELDRTTRVLLAALREPLSEGPEAPDILFNIVKFRFFTWPPTWEALGGYHPAAAWD